MLGEIEKINFKIVFSQFLHANDKISKKWDCRPKAFAPFLAALNLIPTKCISSPLLNHPIHVHEQITSPTPTTGEKRCEATMKASVFLSSH